MKLTINSQILKLESKYFSLCSWSFVRCFYITTRPYIYEKSVGTSIHSNRLYLSPHFINLRLMNKTFIDICRSIKKS